MDDAVAIQRADAANNDDLEADDGISDAPLVRLVNQIIFQAAEDGASDVHFEPQEDALVVRVRIDGVLHVVERIPMQLASGVTTRLKVLAKLDIAERRKPQDGRISLTASAAGRLLDIRVATLPTVEGEAVTMRLLDKSQGGADARGARPLRRDARPAARTSSRSRPARCSSPARPAPASRRRSTRCSPRSSRPEINVITVEDPVEYRLQGTNQVQINPRAGLTFATALRSILRNDPDVVMVGEIRDGETARISIEAALTGHFVLSTLHTNDAPGAVTRLNEMGVEPFITGAAVSAVLAQRLARKLCPHCSESYEVGESDLGKLRFEPERARSGHRLDRYGRRLYEFQPDERRARAADREGRDARRARGRCGAAALDRSRTTARTRGRSHDGRTARGSLPAATSRGTPTVNRTASRTAVSIIRRVARGPVSPGTRLEKTSTRVHVRGPRSAGLSPDDVWNRRPKRSRSAAATDMASAAARLVGKGACSSLRTAGR